MLIFINKILADMLVYILEFIEERFCLTTLLSLFAAVRNNK